MERGNSWLRFFDERIGPRILFFLSFFCRHKLPPSPSPRPLKIGVIKAAALGDTILLSSILTDLHRTLPCPEVILFVGGSNIGLARELAGIVKVIQLPLKNPLAAILRIRREGLDYLVDSDSWPRISALWAALGGARWTIGFQTDGQNRHYCFDEKVYHDPSIHEIDNYRKLILRFCPHPNSPPQDPFQDFIHLRDEKVREKLDGQIDSRFRLPRAPTVALHLWPGGTHSEFKEWPNENWIKLLNRLSRDSRYQFILTGASNDKRKIESFMNLLPKQIRDRVIDVSGGSLLESMCLLKRCVALVSVNTGILHLGAAMNVPVLGLHGPTNPRRWGPVGECHISVLSRHVHGGVLNLGFEYPQDASEIMAQLTVDDVFSGWLELVGKNKTDWVDAI